MKPTALASSPRRSASTIVAAGIEPPAPRVHVETRKPRKEIRFRFRGAGSGFLQDSSEAPSYHTDFSRNTPRPPPPLSQIVFSRRYPLELELEIEDRWQFGVELVLTGHFQEGRRRLIPLRSVGQSLHRRASLRTLTTMLYKTLLPAIAAVAAGQQTCETLRDAFQDNS